MEKKYKQQKAAKKQQGNIDEGALHKKADPSPMAGGGR
jgi:hypothetical protein